MMRSSSRSDRPDKSKGYGSRVEDLPRPGDKGCGASRTKRANDIPRMRRHQSKTIDRKSKRVGGRLVRLGGWLEATHGIDRERAFEEGVQAGICQLLLDGGWRGVRQRDEHPDDDARHAAVSLSFGEAASDSDRIGAPCERGMEERAPAGHGFARSRSNCRSVTVQVSGTD
jgi:hypothetical protein